MGIILPRPVGVCLLGRLSSNVRQREYLIVPTSVYLIRHGAYDHRPSPEGTEASCDFGLSPLGLAQVEALCDRLAQTEEIKADHLFCSTLPRARQTAELLAQSLGLEHQPVAELAEWDSGNEVLGTESIHETLLRTWLA